MKNQLFKTSVAAMGLVVAALTVSPKLGDNHAQAQPHERVHEDAQAAEGHTHEQHAEVEVVEDTSRDIPAPDISHPSFVSLFDDNSLDGWEAVGGVSKFMLYDKSILGVTVRGTPNSFLRTKRDDYENFIFTLEFYIVDKGNSGIQFRSHTNENGVVSGYQSEIDISERAWTAGIYGESWRSWIYKLDQPEHAEAREALQLEDWNRLVIRVVGCHIQTWLNGILVTDFVDDPALAEGYESGFFALQVHSGKRGMLRWRDIKVLELDADGEVLVREHAAEEVAE